MAREVAAQRGLGVVITKNDSLLLAFDDAHDITAALIARLRAQRARCTGETPVAPPAAGHDPRAAMASRPAPSEAMRR